MHPHLDSHSALITGSTAGIGYAIAQEPAAGIGVQQKAASFVDFRPTSLRERFAAANAMSHVAVYLCSELASTTRRAALRVDGGVVNQIM